jgi:two-component system, NtrC family, sensor kinase
VILLTGQASIQDGVEGIKAGAFDYLSKPIEIEQLLGNIRQAYDKLLCKRKKQKEAEFRIKQLHESLAQSMQSEKMDSLGRLAAGVAHEINNPLTGILLYCNMILENLERNHPLERNLRYVIEEANRCKDIVKNLLACCRRESPPKERFELNEIVEESLLRLADQNVWTHVAIAKELAACSIPVRADRNQLVQAVINLVANAADATENDGKISIRTYLDDTTGMACLEVLDTGSGIPPELIPKIFDPFFTTKMPGKGTGLGLSTIFAFAKENKGRISVKETGPEGTTFIMELPAEDCGFDSIG